jgi:hypothetical protein
MYIRVYMHIYETNALRRKFGGPKRDANKLRYLD